MSNYDEWVSGFGSVQGLLRPFHYVFECIYGLDQFCGTFSVNGSDPYTTCTPIVLGVEHDRVLQANVFPNPNEGSFYVQVGAFPARYRLMNALGEEVMSGLFSGLVNTVTVPGNLSGLYLLDVEGRSARVVIH